MLPLINVTGVVVPWPNSMGPGPCGPIEPVVPVGPVPRGPVGPLGPVIPADKTISPSRPVVTYVKPGGGLAFVSGLTANNLRIVNKSVSSDLLYMDTTYR